MTTGARHRHPWAPVRGAKRGYDQLTAHGYFCAPRLPVKSR